MTIEVGQPHLGPPLSEGEGQCQACCQHQGPAVRVRTVCLFARPYFPGRGRRSPCISWQVRGP